MEVRRLFLIVSPDDIKLKWISDKLSNHITNPTIFRAHDGITALAKFQNAPPHVLITDQQLPKLDGVKLLDQAFSARGADSTAFILIGPPPAEESFLDELVIGRVQYWTNEKDENEFTACVMKALNYSAQHDKAEFKVRFLTQGDILIREGDKADNVYFVKKGRLQASKRPAAQSVILGNIEVGEFVGEMAYINGEVRSADVIALTDCELIEVPVGLFEKVLFTRPSWSKALMMTLSKRVKLANEKKLAR